MIKRHFASVCMAIVVILTLCACGIAACASEPKKPNHDDEIGRMEYIINEREAILDSIEARFPLMDTIGEGDEYIELCETRDAFNYCRTYEDKCNHFKVYCAQFDVVMDEIMTVLAEYCSDGTFPEDTVTFEMVRNMYDNGQWWCKSRNK
jgi:hypothetical protein